jgi:hypothetical protein
MTGCRRAVVASRGGRLRHGGGWDLRRGGRLRHGDWRSLRPGRPSSLRWRPAGALGSQTPPRGGQPCVQDQRSWPFHVLIQPQMAKNCDHDRRSGRLRGRSVGRSASRPIDRNGRRARQGWATGRLVGRLVGAACRSTENVRHARRVVATGRPVGWPANSPETRVTPVEGPPPAGRSLRLPIPREKCVMPGKDPPPPDRSDGLPIPRKRCVADGEGRRWAPSVGQMPGQSATATLTTGSAVWCWNWVR